MSLTEREWVEHGGDGEILYSLHSGFAYFKAGCTRFLLTPPHNSPLVRRNDIGYYKRRYYIITTNRLPPGTSKSHNPAMFSNSTFTVSTFSLPSTAN